MVRKLKKPIAFLLSFAMIMTVLLDFPGNTFGMITAGLHASAEAISPAKPDVGEGTEASPYEIDSAQELYWFAALVDGTLTDGTAQNVAAWAKLTANITVNTGVLKEDGTLVSNTSGFVDWTPIATKSKSYSGTFDGQGFTISGLYYEYNDDDAVGLFGALSSDGKIKNVTIADSYFHEEYYVGGICGYSSGEITNCHNYGLLRGYNSIGGICGFNLGTISDCHNAGNVDDASYNLGGICGTSGGDITNCYNTGALSASYSAGGILGYRDGGKIRNCFNIGTVACDNNGVGAICGHDQPSVTSTDPAYINCYYDS